MQHKENRRAVIDPILLLLKSRRVLIALVSLILSIVVIAIPTLQAVHSELLVLVMTLALVLIGGLSIEDAVLASRQQPFNDELQDLIHATTDAIIDELLENEETIWDETLSEPVTAMMTPVTD